MLLLAAIQDIKEFTISNILTFAGMLAGLALHIAYSGYNGFWFSMKGLLFGLIVGEIAALITKLGQGDVFLYAALGSFIGPILVSDAFLLTFTILFIRFAPAFLKSNVIHRKIAVAPYIATSALIVFIIKFAMGY